MITVWGASDKRLHPNPNDIDLTMRGLIFVLRTILSLLNTNFSEHSKGNHHGVGAPGRWDGRINEFAPNRINHIALRHGDVPSLDLGKSRVGFKPLEIEG